MKPQGGNIGVAYADGIYKETKMKKLFIIFWLTAFFCACASNPAASGSSGTVVGETNTSVGTGRANTQRIIPVLNRSGEDGAALLCSELNINGYTGWFLPSRDELNLMYVNLKEKWLGGFRDDWYWSSSEGGRTSDHNSHMSSPDDSAWTQNFKDGGQTNTNYSWWGSHGVKNNSYSVRAARAF